MRTEHPTLEIERNVAEKTVLKWAEISNFAIFSVFPVRNLSLGGNLRTSVVPKIVQKYFQSTPYAFAPNMVLPKVTIVHSDTET